MTYRTLGGILGGCIGVQTYQDIVGGVVQMSGLEQSTELRGAAAGKKYEASEL